MSIHKRIALSLFILCCSTLAAQIVIHELKDGGDTPWVTGISLALSYLMFVWPTKKEWKK